MKIILIKVQFPAKHLKKQVWKRIPAFGMWFA